MDEDVGGGERVREGYVRGGGGGEGGEAVGVGED